MILIITAGTATAAGKSEGVAYVPYSPPAIEYDESDYWDGDYGPIDDESEWPMDEEDQPSFPPAKSENFVWQGHNPADEGWRAEEGDLDQATLIHWSNDIGLTPLYNGGHIFEISPEDSEMVIVAKDFTGNAGEALVITWAGVHTDDAPYMDILFGYMMDKDGVSTTLFSSIVTDGSSTGWETSILFLNETKDFTIYLGGANGSDTEYAPKLLIGGINVVSFGGEKGFTDIAPAAVPIPGAVLLFGSAIGGLTIIRRRKTA